MSDSENSDAGLEVLWKHVLDNWSDDGAHAAFLQACERSDRLVDAAMRYRGMSADRERGPTAQKRLDAVTALALAKLQSSRTEQRPGHRNIAGLLLVIFFVVATFLLLAYLRTS